MSVNLIKNCDQFRQRVQQGFVVGLQGAGTSWSFTFFTGANDKKCNGFVQLYTEAY